jgi:hypothetical protein
VGPITNCTAVQFGTCQGTCLEKSKTKCGIEFSSARQSYFCSIKHTSAWPALLQTPRQPFRALPEKPRLAVMYTGGCGQGRC